MSDDAGRVHFGRHLDLHSLVFVRRGRRQRTTADMAKLVGLDNTVNLSLDCSNGCKDNANCVINWSIWAVCVQKVSPLLPFLPFRLIRFRIDFFSGGADSQKRPLIASLSSLSLLTIHHGLLLLSSLWLISYCPVVALLAPFGHSLARAPTMPHNRPIRLVIFRSLSFVTALTHVRMFYI